MPASGWPLCREPGQGFRDASVVAAGCGDARIVGRVLFQVEAPGLAVQSAEVIGRLVLPACICHERPAGTQSVEDGRHDGLRAACHVAECGHPAVDHRKPARTQPKAGKVPN